MLALNAMVISSPEFKSLRAFVALYTMMWILILSLLASIYYANEKELMLAEHRLSMQIINETYYQKVQYFYLYQNEEFPSNIAYNTAIYDADEKVMETYLQDADINFNKVISLDNGYIHFIVLVGKNLKGAKYLVYETKDNRLWWKAMVKDLIIYGIGLFLFITFVGINLLKIFLRPMRESIELLDNFIKDTTHELNTPVSVIVANIEGIDTQHLDEKYAKKIRRVDIAARTISNIYNDLTYLILHNDIVVKNEDINLSRFLCERVDYFKVTMEQKKIDFIRNVQEDIFIHMDRNKLGRLIDNLISNAIKYNKVKGSIEIKLDKDSLEVIDTGVGIEKDKIDSIFERYHRVNNNSVGGFGIGLHIVAMICKEYNIDIDVNSEIHKGTTIKLYFGECLDLAY